MEAFVIIIFSGIGILTGSGAILWQVFKPREEPYAIGVREEKLEELEGWRDWAIEAVVSEETLDDITNLYHMKLKQIESHK